MRLFGHFELFLGILGSLWEGFEASWGPPWGHFCQNVVFLKIVVFPRKSTDFQGSGVPKIELKSKKKNKKSARADNTGQNSNCNFIFQEKFTFLVDFRPFGGPKMPPKSSPKIKNRN